MEKYGVYYVDYARDDEPIFVGTYEECEAYYEENHLEDVRESSYGEESYEICHVN